MANTGSSIPAGPAPPGHVHNFVNGKTKTGSNIALHTVMLFFVTLSVGVRLYTRLFITHKLGIDDCEWHTPKCGFRTLMFKDTDLCIFAFVS